MQAVGSASLGGRGSSAANFAASQRLARGQGGTHVDTVAASGTNKPRAQAQVRPASAGVGCRAPR
jgi:hypothetical protein